MSFQSSYSNKRARNSTTALRRSTRFSSSTSNSSSKYEIPEIPHDKKWEPPVVINNELAQQDDASFFYSLHPSFDWDPSTPYNIAEHSKQFSTTLLAFDDTLHLIRFADEKYIENSDIIPNNITTDNVDEYIPYHEKKLFKTACQLKYAFGVRTKNPRLGGYIYNWLSSDPFTNHRCKTSPILAVDIVPICFFENTCAKSVNPANLNRYITETFGLSFPTHIYPRSWYLKVKNSDDEYTSSLIMECAKIHELEASENVYENENAKFEYTYKNIAPAPHTLYANIDEHKDIFLDQQEFVDRSSHISVSLPSSVTPEVEYKFVTRMLDEYHESEALIIIADKIDGNLVFTGPSAFTTQIKTALKVHAEDLEFEIIFNDRNLREIRNNYVQRRTSRRPSSSQRSITSTTSSLTNISRPFGMRNPVNPPSSISVSSGLPQVQVQQLIDTNISKLKASFPKEKHIVNESGDNISALIDEKLNPLKSDLESTKKRLDKTEKRTTNLEKITTTLTSNQDTLTASVERSRIENETHRKKLQPFLDQLLADSNQAKADIIANEAQRKIEMSSVNKRLDVHEIGIGKLANNMEDFLTSMNDTLAQPLVLEKVDLSLIAAVQDDDEPESAESNEMDLDDTILTQEN